MLSLWGSGETMFRHFRYLAAWGLVFACSACNQPPAKARVDTSNIRDIQINYRWMGWGSLEEDFTLTPATDGNGFVLHVRYVDSRDRTQDVRQPVPQPAVGALLEAASAPVWTRQAGVRAVANALTPAQIGRFEPPNLMPPSPCTAGELRQLARLYVKRKGRMALVDEYYGQGNSWTDDYPHVLLQIRLRQGPTIVLHSNSQEAAMLPWYRGMPSNQSSETGQDWSIPLSEALRTIAPSESALHKRLGNDGLSTKLKDYTKYAVLRECESTRNTKPRAVGPQ